jgi:hypothetical protein
VAEENTEKTGPKARLVHMHVRIAEILTRPPPKPASQFASTTRHLIEPTAQAFKRDRDSM